MTTTVVYSWAECQFCLKKWEGSKDIPFAHLQGRKHAKETGHRVITEVHLVSVTDGICLGDC